MKIDAVGVSSRNVKKTLEFYKLLGFEFPETKDSEDHVEAKNNEGEVRLMIDSEKMATEVHGEKPQPGNLSVFALKYDSPSEVNEVCNRLEKGDLKSRNNHGMRFGAKDMQLFLIQMDLRLTYLQRFELVD